MDYEQLTAIQALEIHSLTTKLEDMQDRMRKINLILVGIGGPLNDNVLGYSMRQREPFHHIQALTRD